MAQGGSKLIKNKTKNRVLSRPHYVETPSQKAEDEAKPKKNETDKKPINTAEREKIISFQRTMYSPSRIIGSQEEIVPFAWRNELNFSTQKRLSKFLKNQLLQKEKARKERERKILESQQK